MRRKPASPPRVVAVVALKGGVGQTTLVSHLTPPLVQRVRDQHGDDARILVIDAAATGGATFALTAQSPDAVERTIATVLTGEAKLEDALIPLDAAAADDTPMDLRLPDDLARARVGVDLIASNRESARLMITKLAEAAALRTMLHHPRSLPRHPLVVIDCGSEETALTEIAMVAADAIVAVVQPTVWDANGLSNVIRKINELAENFPHVHLAGVIANLVDKGAADQGAMNDLSEQLGPLLWSPAIPYSAPIRRANNQHLPLVAVKPVRPELAGLFVDLAALIYPTPTTSRPRRRRSS